MCHLHVLKLCQYRAMNIAGSAPANAVRLRWRSMRFNISAVLAYPGVDQVFHRDSSPY
jgi:hypothetical protein